MYYEINVSKNKQHFFATAKRSLSFSDSAEIVLNVFKEKFPESEGYELSLSYHPESYSALDINKPIAKQVNDINR